MGQAGILPGDKAFKDFLFSFIIETHGFRASEVTDAADVDWKEQIMFDIGPHPELSDSQKKVIALDYGRRGGKARFQVRRALFYYSLGRLGLDTNPGARAPHEQQIVFLNPGVIGLRNE